MTAIADSTVIFHLRHHQAKMRQIIAELGITALVITRISYLELLAGASENAKLDTRKTLRPFTVLEFDKKAAVVSTTKLAFRPIPAVSKFRAMFMVIRAIKLVNYHLQLTTNYRLSLKTRHLLSHGMFASWRINRNLKNYRW